MIRSLLLAVALVGCGSSDGPSGKNDTATTGATTNTTSTTPTTGTTSTSTGTTSTQSMLEINEYTDQTNPNGRLEIFVDVGPGVTSFQITGDSSEHLVFLDRLFAPDGTQVLFWEDLYWSDRSLTGAIFGDTRTTALNWPVRDVDGPLQQGEWRAVYAVNDREGYYIDNADLDIAVVKKSDPDVSSAVVRVQISYADGVDQNADVVAAIEEAVERWRVVWGAQSLVLEEHYRSTTLDPFLDWTYRGDPSVENVADQKNDGDLHLVVGELIRSEMGTYGISAGIPGTIVPSENTFVNISWLVHAGGNGTFDPDEISLMGETMAHEVGHYAGLYHPVEWGYYWWDFIDDTVECSNANQCESQLGTNLMFPYSICDQNGCLPTEDITPGQ
ncbi:MAG: hypothetical protein GWP91_03585, partial [Rhodobacterales bacterium]|nr:hypothetical protein [Rhodobacterales bacterium]